MYFRSEPEEDILIDFKRRPYKVVSSLDFRAFALDCYGPY